MSLRAIGGPVRRAADAASVLPPILRPTARLDARAVCVVDGVASAASRVTSPRLRRPRPPSARQLDRSERPSRAVLAIAAPWLGDEAFWRVCGFRPSHSPVRPRRSIKRSDTPHRGNQPAGSSARVSFEASRHNGRRRPARRWHRNCYQAVTDVNTYCSATYELTLRQARACRRHGGVW